MTRDQLLGMLWSEADEERARKGLNQALYALRQELGADEVFLGTRDLRLNPELVSSDVAAFAGAIKAGQLERATAEYTVPSWTDFISQRPRSSSAGWTRSGPAWLATTHPPSTAWPGGRPTGATGWGRSSGGASWQRRIRSTPGWRWG